MPTSPRGKAAHASSHWPRDLDPDYARYRRVCWSVWQGSSMLQRELPREAEEMRAERQESFHHPEHMIQHVHGSYLDIHRPYSDCSDYFCDVRQVCKMDRVDRIYCKGKWMLGVRLSTCNYQKTGTYICILSRYAKLTAIYNPAPEPELSHHFTQDNGRQGRPGPGAGFIKLSYEQKAARAQTSKSPNNWFSLKRSMGGFSTALSSGKCPSRWMRQVGMAS